jgi:hypothetical protein
MVLVYKRQRFLLSYEVKLKGKGGTIMTTEDFIIELFCRIDDTSMFENGVIIG